MAVATATREEWQAARSELLAAEKELTRRSDELSRKRQELPWVPVDKEYVFQTHDGDRTLAELFDGRSQLIVYHFMHGPLTPEGCPGCTFHTDTLDGAHEHLAAHDVTFLCAARSPLEELDAYRERMGWTIPFVSSGENDFNRDIAEIMGAERMLEVMELMALSCFALKDGVVHHTYTTFDRGTDVLNPVWQLLDRAPRGREDGEYPGFPNKRDEYDKEDR